MSLMASHITSLTIVYSTVYSGADHRKHQSSTSLAFVRGTHQGPVNSPHKWPVMRKMFPFDDVIMSQNNKVVFPRPVIWLPISSCYITANNVCPIGLLLWGWLWLWIAFSQFTSACSSIRTLLLSSSIFFIKIRWRQDQQILTNAIISQVRRRFILSLEDHQDKSMLKLYQLIMISWHGLW